jgi:hypothetical protein
MNLIARKSYPALDCILWDTKADQITAETAFHLYEKDGSSSNKIN